MRDTEAVEEERRQVQREAGTFTGDADGEPVATSATPRDVERLDAAETVRKLLTPRWILFTLVVAVAVVVCLAMAWWQLTRFDSENGDWQNLGYSLEWPFFAAFAVYVWWKLLREPPASDEEEEEEGDAPDAVDGVRSQGAAPTPRDVRAGAATPPGLQGSTGDTSPGATQPTSDDPEDAELAAYNRYLAALHERARLQERSRRR
ncbi:hypothetical protein [Thermasporomyces composti]|uniref:hypothetical protein n=1 Tax=Thermasporomyces composti TaxID=696763 RepID=UPI0011C078AF|nr:hypothetical protein [Thermasporomyces composti]